MPPRKCLVADCTAKATLFSPRDNEQKVSWQRQIKYTGGINSKSNFRVCEVHFSDAQFEDPNHLLLGQAPRRGKCFLKADAVPDIHIGAASIDVNMNVSTI